MKRVSVHIAMLLALSLGAATGARAITPGVSAFDAAHLTDAVAQESQSSPALLAPINVQSHQFEVTRVGNSERVIPPSAALRAALGYAPGSQGLGVRLLRGPRLVYAVKLKSGNRIRRVLVDAHTGRVLGE